MNSKKMMFEQNVRRCADRIISIYQPHLRPIVRGKAKLILQALLRILFTTHPT
ncbi:hypothetical protein [Prevotella bivia]|uniref:hypothetical protein n=1 Tax=Prevotella bivia TaxID=28125 RepID=UPI002AB8C1B8|nr:hypothetical protein [Prevotella bivia]MDZ3817167.1 hypothetical protein [Prevotella bivia]